MPSGYTRQSVASIVNGNVINASDFNNEYNAILAAFDAVSGHIHDGSTVGGGAPITAVNQVSYPNGAAANTVPVVTSLNTVTYEKVPNSAIQNPTITVGSTAFNLGDTHSTLTGITLTAPNINNATTGGLFTLGGNIVGGGNTIQNAILGGCSTSGTLTLGGGVTATGFQITGGTYNGPAIVGPAFSGTATGNLAGGGTSQLNNFILGATTTSGVLTLGANLNVNSQTITNATIAGPTINNATLGAAPGNGCSIGATLTITGQTIAGGGTGAITGTNLSANCTAVTASTADNSTAIATTAHVKANLASYATLASPALTGNPTAPTQLVSNNSTRIATTAFVSGQFSAVSANPGWYQGGNGMPIFQWGHVTTNASGLASVSLPVTYGTAVFSIQLTLYDASVPVALSSTNLSSSSVTTSGFNINAVQAGVGAAVPVAWFAVGI